MTQRYDLVIAGGGPAGAAAAGWQASQTGARVLIVDKAQFPRDKPCGDGLTPRAVSFIQKMGLAAEVAAFHRVNGARIFSPSEWQLSFPRRPGMPDHGHVARRSELDAMLLAQAASAGAEIRDGAEVVGLQRLLGDRVACRNAGARARDRHAGHPLEAHLRRGPAARLRVGVPRGDGRANIGLGYCTSYRDWHRINATELFEEFIATLPHEWQLPPVDELKRSKALRAWRLPMGFTAWPPWRPGVLFACDALGAARPVSGAGISKALQSGLAAGECAIAALTNGGPGDFTNYAQRVNDAWGSEYRRGRYFHKLVGRPAVAGAELKVLDMVSHPGFRSRFLYWEGWRDPKKDVPVATAG